MAIVALSNARVKARDSRREGDIKQITNALELAFAFNDSYPIPTGNTTVCLSTCTASNWCANLKTQMSSIPNDPLPNQQCYLYNSDGANFRVAAKLESSANYLVAQSDGGLYPQFYEGQSTPGQILLTAYKSVWPTAGLAQLDPNYSSLVGWWDFEEGTGTSASDFSSSSPSNTGTLLPNGSEPTWQAPNTCSSGGCLSFDGSNDYVDVGSNASLNITDAITIEAWIYPKVWGSNWSCIVSKGENWSAGVTFWLNPGGFLYFSVAGTHYGFNAVALNTWTHVVATFSLSNQQIITYINSVASSPQTRSSALPTQTPNLIGISVRDVFPHGYGQFNGFIDEVRIYNIALTASQICHLCKEKKSASFCNNCTE